MKLKRFSSATLVETIIALTIILVIFGMTIIILTQTGQTSFSVKKIKAQFLIDQFAAETEQEKSFFNDSKDEDLFTMQKEVIENEIYKNIVIIKFSVLDRNNKNIYYQNRIFRVK